MKNKNPPEAEQIAKEKQKKQRLTEKDHRVFIWQYDIFNRARIIW